MGWWADGLIQGQSPRKNGCICALLPILGGLLGVAWGIKEAVS
jgi:hypothetical protein